MPLVPTAPPPPELLAPAGDAASFAAALAAGADAVYLGLDDGFNARARAANFSLTDLPDLAARAHRADVKLYVTVNTLLFESEIAAIEAILRAVAAAGVDAILVQDPAVALLAAAICPALHVHASTQMTVSSPEGARFASGLGVTRVVLPRELSVREVERMAEATALELETFVHGALCVSWSGQCLSSEAWGGRSANRGLCAQSCRMPYQLVVDGVTRHLPDQAYLLSPRDQSAVRAVPALLAAGVRSLKIEGRMKGPAYVMTALAGLRAWVDAIRSGRAEEAADSLAEHLADMQLAYSRGFSDGFLAGADHQHLVDGRFPKHRGLFLGEVVERRGCRVRVRRQPPAPDRAEGEPSSPLPAFGGDRRGPRVALRPPRPGLGVVFDGGHPEDADEPGGPIFTVDETPDGWWLGFGRPGPDLDHIAPGQRVWITGDPALQRRAEALVAGPPPDGRLALHLHLSGRPGSPLAATAVSGTLSATARSTQPLAAAGGRGLDEALLRDKLGALGGTPFRLAALDLTGLAPGLHLPVSALKALRRELVAALDAALTQPPARAVAAGDQAPTLRARLATRVAPSVAAPTPPELLPLCRSDEQLDAVIAAGWPCVELDWMEMVGLGRAVARARAAGLAVGIATVRVQKPGERGDDERVERLAPDWVLVRHWGALMHFADAPTRPRLYGDFSLNVTNSLTALHLLGLGLDRVTAAHDLDATQLFALVAQLPPERLTVTVHHHVPTFHTEHCVYAHQLSNGRDYRSCGRPCDHHRVSLRDHLGLEHPVVVDVGCRNTVFNAQAQSAAHLMPRLLAAGVRSFRLELVRETAAETAAVLAAYRDLLAGTAGPRDVVRRVGAHEQFGVTAGTMRVLGQG